jgi:4-hydroxy-tetrahydrodipicolinate synthase
MSVGGKGVVSVASNIIPLELVTLVNYFKENKLKDAIELNKKLYPIFTNLFKLVKLNY